MDNGRSWRSRTRDLVRSAQDDIKMAVLLVLIVLLSMILGAVLAVAYVMAQQLLQGIK